MSITENITDLQTGDEIDLRELLVVLWRGKWIIAIATFLLIVLSVFYTLSLPNIYKSEALVAPVNDDANMRIPGQLGGLAALAGVNLGGGSDNKTALAIEVLKSRDFIGRFIEENDLYVPVMAATGWSRSNNSLEINERSYDSEMREWVREVKAPFAAKPSVQETYAEFMRLLSVSQDNNSGMVRIGIQHFSPYLAKEWVDKLVQAINEDMRQRELSEAKRSIDYLNEQIAQTNLADARTMLFSLVEEQTKTLMLANVRSEYVFKTIDPAIVAERKEKPARALIVVITVFFGVFLTMVMMLASHFMRK